MRVVSSGESKTSNISPPKRFDSLGRRKPYIGFTRPEFEFPWVKEVNSEDFELHPNYSKAPRPYDSPPEPVKLRVLIKILEDALSRPEIVDAYSVHTRAKEGSEERDIASSIRLFFNDYLKYKYGNADNFYLYFPRAMYKITTGEWGGVDDEQFKKEIKKWAKKGKVIQDVWS